LDLSELAMPSMTPPAIATAAAAPTTIQGTIEPLGFVAEGSEGAALAGIGSLGGGAAATG
jgi:hypothetical protein